MSQTDIRHPADRPQRQRALDPTGSFICEAPAGSGKTELLTQRVLTLLARVTKPESILAITFTRKAAAEMRARILGALAAGRGPEPQEAHALQTWQLARDALQADERYGWQLLTNPSRLQIRTFDSLCAMLTQALPLQSSLGAGVATTEDAQPLYKAAVKDLLDTLESEMPWADSLAQLLGHLDNRYSRLEELLCKMLGSRDIWLPVLYQSQGMGTQGMTSPDALRDLLEYHLQHALIDKMTRLRELLPPECHQTLAELGDFAAANLLRENVLSPINPPSPVNALHQLGRLPDCRPEEMPQWRGLACLLLTQKGEWRKTVDKRAGFPAGEGKDEKAAYKRRKDSLQELIGQLQEVPDLLEALQGISAWPAPTYNDQQWQILQALTAVLPVLVAHLKLVFAARGEVDFVEISSRARQALGDEQAPTELALRLDHRIQHILVDEFQDTSFSQVDLLQRLTAGWQPGDGRTLFCVGDAMQSIYGFRNANVGLFLHCKEHGLGGLPLEPLQLTANFRSQAGVVEWINRVFQRAFPARHNISSGAVAFSPAEAFRPEIPGPAVQTHLYEKGLPAEFEGQLVCDLIQQARAQNPDGTIALLVRNRNHAAHIIPALKAAGLTFRAVDLETLAEQPVVMDLMSLTQALLFPADRIHWLAILRAPWCGLTLADLEIIANQGPAETPIIRQMHSALAIQTRQEELFTTERALSADGRARLQRITPILQTALAERHRKPLRQWVEGTWIALGGPACLQQASELDDAERFLQLLEKLNATGDVPTLEQLNEGLEKLFAAPDPQADERLQIMTMHKSKGLEFDTVILPGLHRQPRNQDSELLLWQERLSLDGREEWLLAPISATGQDKDPIYKHLEYEQKKRTQLEACRLLYVACTRARKQLHLLAQIKAKEGEVREFCEPAENTLLKPIWSSVHTTAVFYPAPKTAEENADLIPQYIPRPLQRIASNWQMPQLPRVDLLQPFIANYQYNNQNLQNAQSNSEKENSSARLIGTLTHEVLQLIGQQGLHNWKNRNLDEVEPFWRGRLLSLGMNPTELDAAVQKLKTLITQTLQHPKFEWLLSGNCQFELPISVVINGAVEHRVIDVLRTEGNKAWVVDYKTSVPMEGESVQQFVEREVSVYKQIMRAYCEAVKGMGYGEVEGVLGFLGVGVWVPTFETPN